MRPRPIFPPLWRTGRQMGSMPFRALRWADRGALDIDKETFAKSATSAASPASTTSTVAPSATWSEADSRDDMFGRLGQVDANCEIWRDAADQFVELLAWAEESDVSD
mmetsp:Transcript_40111/g.115272  ORF Transcript_40111/g.115272 Transcript_40111/m.115272 type:complete len:108 (+) Transcript_40111:44-367(+)